MEYRTFCHGISYILSLNITHFVMEYRIFCIYLISGNIARIPEIPEIIKNSKNCNLTSKIDISLKFDQGQEILFNLTKTKNTALNSPVFVVRKDNSGSLFVKKEFILDKQVSLPMFCYFQPCALDQPSSVSHTHNKESYKIVKWIVSDYN